MERRMSKLKVIDGGPKNEITLEEIKESDRLMAEFSKKTSVTDRDCVVYAYHLVKLHRPKLAEDCLNRVGGTYFDSGIYKDLFSALLTWSVTQVNPSLRTDARVKNYEYFIIVKRVVNDFSDLNFATKSNFLRFKQQFSEYGRLNSQV